MGRSHSKKNMLDGDVKCTKEHKAHGMKHHNHTEHKSKGGVANTIEKSIYY